MKTIKTLAAALLLTLFAGSMANAQTPTNDPPAGGLTIEKLGETLDLLGYEYEALKNSEGKVVAYAVKIERNGKSCKVFIEFTRDKSMIWMQINLQKLKSEDRADGSRLFKLLELNDKIGPCHFFIADNGMLVMGLARDNKAVAAKDLRKQLDQLFGCVLATEKEWAASTPAPSPMPIPVPVEDMQ